MNRVLLVLLLVSLLAPAATTTVTGRVTLGGPLPPPDPMWVTRGAGCPELIADDRLAVLADGSLRDSVVTLVPEAAVAEVAAAGIASGAAPTPPAEVRGLHCALAPRVQVARPGSTLRFASEPGSGHRFHAYRDGNTLRSGDGSLDGPLVLREPGIVDVRCDAGHEWEVAWVVVTDAAHAAVTAADGTFAIERVPRGAYTLTAFHPYLGRVKAPVRVNPGEPRGLVVSISGRGAVEALYPEQAEPASP